MPKAERNVSDAVARKSEGDRSDAVATKAERNVCDAMRLVLSQLHFPGAFTSALSRMLMPDDCSTISGC